MRENCAKHNEEAETKWKPPTRIELAAFPLPRERSTGELQRHNTISKHKIMIDECESLKSLPRLNIIRVVVWKLQK